MKKRKILTVVLCLMLILSSIGFIACGGNKKTDDENSEHIYETTWTYDDTGHWHKCTEDGCTSVSGKAQHNFVNGVCECGAKKKVEVTTQMLDSFTKSVANLENSEGYNVVAKGITFSMNTVYSVKTDSVTTDGDSRLSIPITGDITADVEMFIGKDAEGNLDAKGTAQITATGHKNTTEERFKDVEDVVTIETLKAAFAVKDEYIYAQYEMTDSAEGLPDGWISRTEDISGDVKISFDDLIAMLNKSNTDSDSSKVPTALIQALPEIAEKLDEFIQPIAEKAYTLSMSVAGEYLANIIENTLGITETEDGYVFSGDLEKTKAIINDLIDLTMSEFINKYVGENTVEKLALFAKKVADMNVVDIITFAETKLGFDFDKVEELANELLIAMSQDIEGVEPADNTLAAKLGYDDMTKDDGTAYTFRDFVVAQVSDMTVSELIEQLAKLENGDIDKYINQAVIFLNQNTCLDMISLISGEDLSKVKEQIRATAIEIATVLDKTVKCELMVAKDGTFKGFSVSVAVDKETVSDIIKIMESFDMDLDIDDLEVLNASANISVSIGGFANELDFNYDKLVSNIEAKNQKEAIQPAA